MSDCAAGVLALCALLAAAKRRTNWSQEHSLRDAEEVVFAAALALYVYRRAALGSIVVVVGACVRALWVATGSWEYFDFLAKNVQPSKFMHALKKYYWLQIRLINSPWKMSAEDMRLLMFYEGLISRHRTTCGRIRCYCREDNQKRPAKFLKCLAQQKSIGDKRFLEAFLIAQMIDIWPSITKFRSHLIAHDKEYLGLFGRIRFYQIIKYYELLLNSIQKDKFKGDSKLSDLNFEEFSNYLVDSKQYESCDDFFDIGSLLEIKKCYLEMISLTLELIDITRVQFERLSLSEEIKSKSIHKFNKAIISLDSDIQELGNHISKEFSNTLPSYITLSQAFYLKNVRNETGLGLELYNMYWQRMLKLRGRIHNCYSLKINVNDFQIDSTVLKISGEYSTLGDILDNSPETTQLLGNELRWTGGKVPNINDLIPDIIADEHKEKMKDLSNFNDFIGKKRGYILKGFDGYLRSSSFLINIQSSIKSEFSLLVYLKVSQIEKECRVIVDITGLITTYTKKFQISLERITTLEIKHISISQISTFLWSAMLNKLDSRSNRILIIDTDSNLQHNIIQTGNNHGKVVKDQPHPNSIDFYLENRIKTDSIRFADIATYEINSSIHIIEDIQGSSFNACFTIIDFYGVQYFDITFTFYQLNDLLEDISVNSQSDLDRDELIPINPNDILEENGNEFDNALKQQKRMIHDKSKGILREYPNGTNTNIILGDIDRIRPSIEYPSSISRNDEHFKFDISGQKRKSLKLGRLSLSNLQFPKRSYSKTTLKYTKIAPVPVLINQNPVINTPTERRTFSKRETIVNSLRIEDDSRVMLMSSNNIDRLINVFKSSRLQQAFRNSTKHISMASLQRNSLSMDNYLFVDKAVKMPQKNKIRTTICIIILLYITLFAVSFVYYLARLTKYQEGSILIDLFNDDFIFMDISMKSSILEIIEFTGLAGIGKIDDNESFKYYNNSDIDFKRMLISRLELDRIEVMTRYKGFIEMMSSNIVYFNQLNYFLTEFIYSKNNISIVRYGEQTENFSLREINIIQLIFRYNNIIKELLSIFNNGDFGSKKSSVFIDFMFDNIVDTLFSTIDEFLGTREIDRLASFIREYEFECFIFLTLYVVIACLIYFAYLGALWRYSNRLYDALSSYSLLNEDEICFQISLLKIYTKVFQIFKFNEKEMLETLHYSNEPVKKTLTIKSKGAKIKDQNRVTGGPKIGKSRIRSVVKSTIYGVLILIEFFLFAGYIFMDYSFIKRDYNLIALTAGLAKSYREHNNMYTSVLMNSLFSEKYRIGGKNVSRDFLQNGYSRSINYFEDYAKSTPQLIRYIGEESMDRYKELLYDSICSEFIKIAKEAVFVCENFNGGAAKQGILNFFYYEDQLLKKIQDEINSHRVTLATDKIWDTTEMIDKEITMMLWTRRDFQELRIAHMFITPYAIEEMIHIIHEKQERNYKGIHSIMNIFFVWFVFLITLSLLAFMATVERLTKEDDKIAFESFRILHPKFLLSNAYLFNRFKGFVRSSSLI